MKAGRVPFATAGAAYREAHRRASDVEAAARSAGKHQGLSKTAWRTLSAISCLVSSYSRSEDRVTQTQLAGEAQLSVRKLRDALAELRAAGIVTIEQAPGKTPVIRLPAPEAQAAGKPEQPCHACDGTWCSATDPAEPCSWPTCQTPDVIRPGLPILGRGTGVPRPTNGRTPRPIEGRTTEKLTEKVQRDAAGEAGVAPVGVVPA